ncbi:1,2-phenylacetyl-CoA epoxidase subunit PaaD [Kitasatospora sp. NPDC056327]|uniref:1,2-phenylacetyl-CoA epoxidase subunit PaaD n=1 Tax=Kitasatospora sp. NPDC056327 TaxID=3345785 RepID=UPI0035DBE761
MTASARPAPASPAHPGPGPGPGPDPGLDAVRARIADVPDPELPMLTLADLGVIRAVGRAADGTVEVVYTPTYLGCPALPAIEAALREALEAGGHPGGRVRQELTPAWSTDAITPEGRRRLAAYGIVPPGPAAGPVALPLGTGVRCPHCGSTATRPQSLFGATRCQALLHCTACRESFAHLKPA